MLHIKFCQMHIIFQLYVTSYATFRLIKLAYPNEQMNRTKKISFKSFFAIYKKSVFKNEKGNKNASKTSNARNIFYLPILGRGGGLIIIRLKVTQLQKSQDDTAHTNPELHNRQKPLSSTGVMYMSVSSVLNILYTIFVFFQHAILPLEEQ